MADTPYSKHIADELKADVSNILWKSIPQTIRTLDGSRHGGSNLLQVIVEAYAIQFDTLRAAVNNMMEARQTSHKQYLQDFRYAFTDEIYSFLAQDLGVPITPEILGSTLYEDGSNIWQSEFEKEQWEIILQNAPYFYQKRGTLEGLRSLSRMFGLATAGEDTFPFNPNNPIISTYPHSRKPFDDAESKLHMPSHRFLGNKQMVDYASSDDQETERFDYEPNWMWWGEQIGSGRYTDLYVPYVDVAERGIFTNVFLPHDPDTYSNYQWIADKTPAQGHFENIFNALATGNPSAYSIGNIPDYNNWHHAPAHQRKLSTADVENLIDDANTSADGITIQATILPDLRFYKEETAQEYVYGRSEENGVYDASSGPSYHDGRFMDGFTELDGSGNNWWVQNGNTVAEQRILQMYPILTVGSLDTDPEELAQEYSFGDPSSNISLVLFDSEFHSTLDYLSNIDGEAFDYLTWFRDLSIYDASSPWDTHYLAYGDGGLMSYLDSITPNWFGTFNTAWHVRYFPDWWDFRDEIQNIGRYAFAYGYNNNSRYLNQWIDLISMGPKVYMPFPDLDDASVDYWEPPYDESGNPLEPSAPIISFTYGTDHFTACPMSKSAGWRDDGGGTWVGDFASNDPRWAYEDPSDHEPMYGGGFVLSVYTETADNAFARLPYQAIIRQWQADLVTPYPARDGSDSTIADLWKYHPEASNWQHDHRYTNDSDETVYPSNFTSEEGLITDRNYSVEGPDLGIASGRQNILYDLGSSAEWPHGIEHSERMVWNVSGETVASGESTADQNARYYGIPKPINPGHTYTRLKVTAVIDPDGEGTGPSNANVRWYVNGNRIWYADYRFTRAGTTGDLEADQIILDSDNWISDADIDNNAVIQIGNIPHSKADLDVSNDWDRRWWFNGDGTTEDFWGIANDTSNIWTHVQKVRRPKTLSHIALWNKALDKSSELVEFVSKHGWLWNPYVNAETLDRAGDSLLAYYPLSRDSRSEDFDEYPFDIFMKSRLTLFDYSKVNDFHVYAEASNGLNDADGYQDLHQYAQSARWLQTDWSLYGKGRGNYIDSYFGDASSSNFATLPSFQSLQARFIEDTWRSPLKSQVPVYMADSDGNLKEAYWNYRSIRPVSELKTSQIIGEITNSKSARRAKAEWLHRSKHLHPQGEDSDGNEIYTTDGGSEYNRWASNDQWASQSDYYNMLPSSPYWQVRTGTEGGSAYQSIHHGLQSMTKPDPWNYLLKYADQGSSWGGHGSINEMNESDYIVTEEDSITHSHAFARPIYDQSHKIPTPPIIWTYGGVMMDGYGNDDTGQGGTATDPIENIMAVTKGWLPRASKKSYGQFPSNEWESGRFGAIDSDAHTTPHIFLSKITEDSMVSATDVTFMPFIDILQPDFLFVRVQHITHSANNTLFAIALGPIEGNTGEQDDYHLFSSIDGGMTWYKDSRNIPQHIGKSFSETRQILDMHVHPKGVYAEDWWVYRAYGTYLESFSHDSWGMISLYNQTMNSAFTPRLVINKETIGIEDPRKSLDIWLSNLTDFYYSLSDDPDIFNILWSESAQARMNFLDSKHSVMDIGYGGGAVVIKGSQMGRSGGGDYDADGMNSDDIDYLVIFGGAGHPFSPDYYNNFYTTPTAKGGMYPFGEASSMLFEVSNFGVDSLNQGIDSLYPITIKPKIGHFGNRLGGGSFYGSRHMSPHYGGLDASGGYFFNRGGLGIESPRNWGLDFPFLMFRNSDTSLESQARGYIGTQAGGLHYPRFGSFGLYYLNHTFQNSERPGLAFWPLVSQDTGIHTIASTPAMHRGDSQYMQGNYQYVSHIAPSNCYWMEDHDSGDSMWVDGEERPVVFINYPSNDFGPSNNKYYNYGLNYPMSLLDIFDQTDPNVHENWPTYSETLATNHYYGGAAYHPYYLPSNLYPAQNFIPTLLGRDAQIYNKYADDAFMNMASFIRFNMKHPDPSGRAWINSDVSNVYQGSFSQFPYLFNQWTRPINLMGGHKPRHIGIASLLRSQGTDHATLASLLEDGYFNDLAYDPNFYLRASDGDGVYAPSNRLTTGGGGGGSSISKFKILDVQDVMQPIRYDKQKVLDADYNRIAKIYSGFANALTQSIMADEGTPRATAFRLSGRPLSADDSFPLGRKSYSIRLLTDTPNNLVANGYDWDYVRNRFNQAEGYSPLHSTNTYAEHLEEFDAPTARIFFANAYNSDDNEVYTLGGVPNTFSLGHGGYQARYAGGQTKSTDIAGDVIEYNLYDNNYFGRESEIPKDNLTYLSYDQTKLLEAASPFWGGYKGMKRVSFNQNIMFVGPDATNLGAEANQDNRANMIWLDMSNPDTDGEDSSNMGTQWFTAWGSGAHAHEDEYEDSHSPHARIFGQLVYVKLEATEVNDASNAGSWLYYIGGTDNLTNLETMSSAVDQGLYSAGFYNPQYMKRYNQEIDSAIEGETPLPQILTDIQNPLNSWWLTGVPDYTRTVFDPFYQWKSVGEASNLFQYANSGFIGTSVNLEWKTYDDAGAVDYGDETDIQSPFNSNNPLFKGYGDLGGELAPAHSRYHELTGPVNSVFRFKIKDADGNWVLQWDDEGSTLDNWKNIMKGANESDYGYTGDNYGVIAGYFSPDFVDDQIRAKANQGYMGESGLFDHSALVANDGTGKKLYIFGGNTSNNGEYDREWIDPAEYYDWDNKDAISDKGKPIAVDSFGQSGFGMHPIAGIGASSSRQLYIYDFGEDTWSLGEPMIPSDQKIGGAKVPIIWRGRGEMSPIGALTASNPQTQPIIYNDNTYHPMGLYPADGVGHDHLYGKEYYYRGFAYLRGGSSPVNIPCTDSNSAEYGFAPLTGWSAHPDYTGIDSDGTKGIGPFEWIDTLPDNIKWYSGVNDAVVPDFLPDAPEIVDSTGVVGLGPILNTYRILPDYFDTGKWSWGRDPRDYMASPMRKIRIFMDSEYVGDDSLLNEYNSIVWRGYQYLSGGSPTYFVEDHMYKHVYYDVWTKVGWGNDMLLPPNPTQEWVGWMDGNAGYRGMSSCVIPLEDISNLRLSSAIGDSEVIGDWIISAGGYSDGIFTPETGNTKWHDLNSQLNTRRKIAEEINKNLGVTYNQKVFLYKTYDNEWSEITGAELPTPQIWGNAVWSPALRSIIFTGGKTEVRTKAGIPRLITQPDDPLETNASDIKGDSVNLLDSDSAFYNQGNLGNFAWAGMYKNWREADRFWDDDGKSQGELIPAETINALMFTQPTLSMSWNPLSQIRWNPESGERAGSYIDYMKLHGNRGDSYRNIKLGISTATGWNEIGGTENGHTYGLGTGDMHWWGYPGLHDWRAGQRYRAMVAPPPPEFLDPTSLAVLQDPSQCGMYSAEVDRQIHQWVIPHKSLMRLPYYVSGWNHLVSAPPSVGTSVFTDEINRTENPYFMKFADVLGALRTPATDFVKTLDQYYGSATYGTQSILPLYTIKFDWYGVETSYPVLWGDVVKYPIFDPAVQDGNMHMDDIYSPWHGMWDISDQLGRSVREFGGVSFDSWIGYMHGGGRKYTNSWLDFKESPQNGNWWPRGKDLAKYPSNYYANLNNIYQSHYNSTSQEHSYFKGVIDTATGYSDFLPHENQSLQYSPSAVLKWPNTFLTEAQAQSLYEDYLPYFKNNDPEGHTISISQYGGMEGSLNFLDASSMDCIYDPFLTLPWDSDSEEVNLRRDYGTFATTYNHFNKVIRLPADYLIPFFWSFSDVFDSASTRETYSKNIFGNQGNAGTEQLCVVGRWMSPLLQGPAHHMAGMGSQVPWQVGTNSVPAGGTTYGAMGYAASMAMFFQDDKDTYLGYDSNKVKLRGMAITPLVPATELNKMSEGGIASPFNFMPHPQGDGNWNSQGQGSSSLPKYNYETETLPLLHDSENLVHVRDDLNFDFLDVAIWEALPSDDHYFISIGMHTPISATGSQVEYYRSPIGVYVTFFGASLLGYKILSPHQHFNDEVDSTGLNPTGMVVYPSNDTNSIIVGGHFSHGPQTGTSLTWFGDDGTQSTSYGNIAQLSFTGTMASPKIELNDFNGGPTIPSDIDDAAASWQGDTLWELSGSGNYRYHDPTVHGETIKWFHYIYPIMDIEYFDIDNDGEDELVVCGLVGVQYWKNNTWTEFLPCNEDAASGRLVLPVAMKKIPATNKLAFWALNVHNSGLSFQVANNVVDHSSTDFGLGTNWSNSPHGSAQPETVDRRKFSISEITFEGSTAYAPPHSTQEYSRYWAILDSDYFLDQPEYTITDGNGDPHEITPYMARTQFRSDPTPRLWIDGRSDNIVSFPNAFLPTTPAIPPEVTENIKISETVTLHQHSSDTLYSIQDNSVSPWSYIRHDNSSYDENPVPLQNVHAFTDTVDYNPVIVSGYMSPFWSAVEEEISKIEIDPEDPAGSQLKRFFGTANKVASGSDSDLAFEDVWSYDKWQENNVSIAPNVPRLIFQTSNKIFNQGKMFELHFSPLQKRNAVSGTYHQMHYVGYNGYYVTGLYEEDTAQVSEWDADVFRVFAGNPLKLNPNLNITAIDFNDDIHSVERKGVMAFSMGDSFYSISETIGGGAWDDDLEKLYKSLTGKLEVPDNVSTSLNEFKDGEFEYWVEPSIELIGGSPYQIEHLAKFAEATEGSPEIDDLARFAGGVYPYVGEEVPVKIKSGDGNPSVQEYAILFNSLGVPWTLDDLYDYYIGSYEYQSNEDTHEYQWGFYPKKPVYKFERLKEFDPEIFAQEVAGQDPFEIFRATDPENPLKTVRAVPDFQPNNYQNWRLLDYKGLTSIFKDVSVAKNENNITEAWIVGDEGAIIHSSWDGTVTRGGNYVGFSNFEIQNISNSYARKVGLKALVPTGEEAGMVVVSQEKIGGVNWDLVDLAKFAAKTSGDPTAIDLAKFAAGEFVFSEEYQYVDFPSITSEDFVSVFFVGKDLATEDNQIGKYGWVLGEKGSILRTEDGGVTWQTSHILKDILEDIPDISDLAKFASGWDADEYDISDFARFTAEWGKRDISCKKIVFYDTQNGFITTDKGIFKTNDGGKIWWFADENSLNISPTTEWTDIVALPERYRLWNQTVFPKVFAISPYSNASDATEWRDEPHRGDFHHKSVMGIGGVPLKIKVPDKNIKGTPHMDDNITTPSHSESGENIEMVPAKKEGYTFYPSNKVSLHLYDPSKHIREGDV